MGIYTYYMIILYTYRLNIQMNIKYFIITSLSFLVAFSQSEIIYEYVHLFVNCLSV